MAKSAKFSLKLLIDEKKNKVVLAEASQDFVDVLFSLLTLPMGTIARLLEEHQKLPQVLSCYKNLNKSVANLGIDNFATEACKTMLMNPKSMKEIHCRRLKLNLDGSEPSKFFTCPNFYKNVPSCLYYSNFQTSKCSCGRLMSKRVQIPEEELAESLVGNGVDGVFVNCRSSFIVTDDLKVTLNSIDAMATVLKDLGYKGFNGMREMVLQVGFNEVLVLLQCLFTRHAPLTYAFLKKDIITPFSQPLQEIGKLTPGNLFYIKVFVRKLDKMIIYAECGVDFIDSLLTFLVLPLELAWSICCDNNIFECVKNLHTSGCRRPSDYSLASLPGYYACGNSILPVYPHPLRFHCLIPKDCKDYSTLSFTKNVISSRMRKQGDVNVNVSSNDPKNNSGTMTYKDGFLRKGTRFIMSDDLTISPMISSSTIGLLKENQLDIGDIEGHLIKISRTELVSILRASFISSSALTTGLSSFLMKKPKEEN